jgi:hypothetical protein
MSRHVPADQAFFLAASPWERKSMSSGIYIYQQQ